MENTVKKESRVNPKENLRQRGYLNSVTSIIDYGGAQITGFIVSPFIVNGLGSTFYGIWQMLTQMTGYANMADTRATQVLKWSIAKKRGIAGHDELKSEVTTALLVTTFMLPLVLLVGGGLVWYAPYITQADERYFDLIRITCSILLFSLIIYKVFDIFESILRGMNLGFKGMGIRTIIIVLGGALKVLVISLGYGIVGLSIVQVIVGLITGFAFFIIVKKNVPWFGFGQTNIPKLISYSKLSGWFMANSMTNMILMYSDKIILGYLAGPVLVSTYTISMFTSVAVIGIINAVISGVIPGLGNLFGNQEFEKVKAARKLIISLIWIFIVAFGVSVLLFNYSFVYNWVGKEHYAGRFENMLILLIAFQYIFFHVDSTIINVTLNLQTKVFLSFLSCLITLILSFLLIEKYLIIGLCISILCGRAVLNIGYPLILMKKMNYKFSFFKWENIRPMLVAIFLFSLATYGSQWILLKNWGYLIAVGGTTIIVSGLLFWLTGINSKNKEDILGLVSKIHFFGKS